MIDNQLIYLEGADMSGTPASNVLVSPTPTVSGLTKAGVPRYAKNPSGAGYLNVKVTSAMTGALTVTLNDSADGVTYTAVTNGVITLPSGAAAGTIANIPIPMATRKYTKVVPSVATAGKFDAWIGVPMSND